MIMSVDDRCRHRYRRRSAAGIAARHRGFPSRSEQLLRLILLLSMSMPMPLLMWTCYHRSAASDLSLSAAQTVPFVAVVDRRPSLRFCLIFLNFFPLRPVVRGPLFPASFHLSFAANKRLQPIRPETKLFATKKTTSSFRPSAYVSSPP